MEQTTFTIRAYGIGELAELYSPHLSRRAATLQLWRWINFHGVLKAKLLELGYHPGVRSFTPRQVECIVLHLGEP
ncbi:MULTISPECIES: DUF4248 domain-containing protein [Parabacteroides]|uniref:DUF4248 domain-containing protein n=1 Tax=Parabacteroides sp. TaxID=1869337 RepID=UPI00101CD897|nr:DUF4248 domain-containing protein [Parabacteroides goldsteinii]